MSDVVNIRHLCDTCVGRGCNDCTLTVEDGDTVSCTGWLIDDGGPVGEDCCDSCSHLRQESQKHPYGNGLATKHYAVCGAGVEMPDTNERCEKWKEDGA